MCRKGKQKQDGGRKEGISDKEGKEIEGEGGKDWQGKKGSKGYI